jgi:oligopeptide transport system permease protein
MRLQRNKAAMASLVILGLYVLAGIFGPMLWPHDYGAVYPDYVKVPASLEPYPREENVIPGAEEALARAGSTSRTCRSKAASSPSSRPPPARSIPRMTRYSRPLQLVRERARREPER